MLDSLHDPWFAPGDAPAVRDFWGVYVDHFVAVDCPADVSSTRVGELLASGFERGNWEGYEELLARRGRAFAHSGLDPNAHLGSRILREVAPALVAAYAAAPRVLSAALGVAETFGERRIAIFRAAIFDALGTTWAERSMALTLDSIGDGVIATDAHGNIERMNAVALKLARWTLDDARGQPLDTVFRVVDEETGLVVPTRIEEVLSRGVAADLPRHSAILAKDDTLQAIGDSMAPIYDDQGSIRGAVVVFRDLSSERDHERALESVAQTLGQSQRMLSFLADHIDGHRARTAMLLIDGLAGLRTDLQWLSEQLPATAEQMEIRIAAMSSTTEELRSHASAIR